MTAQRTDRKPVSELPKSWRFTSKLPADSAYPTPDSSHQTPRDAIRPRIVRNALFTWVRPESAQNPELLAVSPAALRDIGIDPLSVHEHEFLATVSGNKIQGWEEGNSKSEGYPWAQCYGGFQFGQWAGQLGDGRAISLFETTNAATKTRYELQLKGAGITPYSRFADGKAVLRSSIREFVVSEALHALGIPTTRALSLVLLPHEKVFRERAEPGAIVLRFAPSWLRIGTFDLLRSRGDRMLTRKLAEYVGEEVLGGWDALPGQLTGDDVGSELWPPSPALLNPRRGISKGALEGSHDSEMAENRFGRLYREVVRRNALTVAQWQAYGFMNGVLNTDNTSIMGLSMDFGPFAFMDVFDPNYTPNHDDPHRYAYRSQVSIIWWNLKQLGEALAELLGAGPLVDDEKFVMHLAVDSEENAQLVYKRSRALIDHAGAEYMALYTAEYKRLMALRLGIRHQKEADFKELTTPLLEIMQDCELDFNLFFRRLSTLPLEDISTVDGRTTKAAIFFPRDEQVASDWLPPQTDRNSVATWLDKWRSRIIEDWGNSSSSLSSSKLDEETDSQRRAAMCKVNPSFIPRGWILDEVIHRVEKKEDRDVLKRVMRMALNPFEDRWDGVELKDDTKGKDWDVADWEALTGCGRQIRETDNSDDGGETKKTGVTENEGMKRVWEGDRDEEIRWMGDPPKTQRGLQCSCSS